jgi:S-DNA-T family DNA segregation ATPase FtsK/SpoIIIE
VDSISVSNQEHEELIMPVHIDSNLIELAQTIVHTLATHRAHCQLVEAIDSYKFVRFLVRADSSTRIASVKELDECLWASLGIKIPELEKLPLISQVKGGLIAIDVPKPKSLWRTAYFRDFIKEVDEPLGFESPLIATIGIDLGGNLVCLNLSDALCHLLIGGITRGGKSEFALSVLSDIIWHYKPSRVKLALSDIQQVTFESFKNIPHLFAPVANSVRETIELLQTVEKEMDSRASLFVKVGAKKLNEYNLRVSPEKQLPQILVYVEEIADCMLSEIVVTIHKEKKLKLQPKW